MILDFVGRSRVITGFLEDEGKGSKVGRGGMARTGIGARQPCDDGERAMNQ